MKKNQEKLYHVATFYDFISLQVNSLFHDQPVAVQKMRQVDAILKKENLRLTGKTFYSVVHTLGLDLTTICQQFFKYMPLPRVNYSEDQIEKVSDLLLNAKINLASKYAEESPLNDLFNKKLDHIYAYEVCTLATALGVETHTLFECFYGNKKNKIVLKLEFIDDDTSTKEEDWLKPDPEITLSKLPIQKFIRKRNISNGLKEQQYSILDYMVNNTDFFFTPRTVAEIIKEIENNYSYFQSPLNINNLLKRYVNKELTKIKTKTIKENGDISKREIFTYTKILKEHVAIHEFARYVKPADRSRVAKFTKYKNKRLKIHQDKQKEEMDTLDQLYAVTAANPGKPLSFYLKISDIKARVLESQLQKLMDAGRLEYRGTNKSGGYWVVERDD